MDPCRTGSRADVPLTAAVLPAAHAPGYGAVYSADRCVTRTESHSWPPPTAARGGAVGPLMRMDGPSLSGRPNGRFPALMYGHLETSLEPVLPAILIHKDEDDGGDVTGPGAMPAGEAGSQPAARWPGRRSIVGYYRRLARPMPSTRTGVSRHRRGFRYEPDRLIYR
jgi:hypothetical protein